MTSHSPNSRFWKAHVEAQAKSGLSRAKYCRQHELSYHTLTYWHRKLRHHDFSNSPQLVPIPERTIQSALARPSGDMRVVLANNISIELSNSFSSDALARLLPLLASR